MGRNMPHRRGFWTRTVAFAQFTKKCPSESGRHCAWAPDPACPGHANQAAHGWRFGQCRQRVQWPCQAATRAGAQEGQWAGEFAKKKALRGFILAVPFFVWLEVGQCPKGLDISLWSKTSESCLSHCHNLEIMVGAAGFELATLCSQSRCATRLRYAPTKRILRCFAGRFFEFSKIFQK